MKTRVLAAFLLALPAAAASAAEPKAQDLKTHPVCEASATAWAPCRDDSKAQCALIADNEQRKKVFRYRLDGSATLLPAEPPEAWDLKTGVDVKDAEALASTKSGWLLLGSHGRKKSCEPDPERLRSATLSVKDGKLTGALLTEASAEGWRALTRDCGTGLLKGVGDSDLKNAVCKALEDVESQADAAFAAKSPPDACSTSIASLNLEGAVAVFTPKDGERIWVGVRAPVLPETGVALLLRIAPVKPGSAASFDAVATIDLGGKGIRDLTIQDGRLFGIGGNALDGSTESVLWTVPAEKLDDKAQISAGDVRMLSTTLPAGAEGLLIDAAAMRAIVVIDGEEGEKDATSCNTPATQLVVPLPR